MPSWHCPHCGVAQPETARCWVCHRSTTCCATCRHFRRAVASGLGFCGLDRRRLPLHGDEMRPCWAGSIGPLLQETIPLAVRDTRARPPLAFVDVEPSGPVRSGPSAVATIAPPAVAAPIRALVDPPGDVVVAPPLRLGWTLWGDAFL
jgi:hypothetical protein